jgi:hypothetical protein
MMQTGWLGIDLCHVKIDKAISQKAKIKVS